MIESIHRQTIVNNLVARGGKTIRKAEHEGMTAYNRTTADKMGNGREISGPDVIEEGIDAS